MNSTLVLQAIVSGFLLGGVYSLICVGLTLTFGVMRIINFAHGEFPLNGRMLGNFPQAYSHVGLSPIVRSPDTLFTIKIASLIFLPE